MANVGTANLGTIFVAIAVIFLAVAVKNYLSVQDHLTPARQTWLRMAIIFSTVGLILSASNLLWQ